MPAEVRRDVIKKVAGLLRTQGQLFLSLDLIPGGNLLWNLSEGKVVDEADHGTLDDIKAELEAVGLAVLLEKCVREIPMSRTDVGYLVCSKQTFTAKKAGKPA